MNLIRETDGVASDILTFQVRLRREALLRGRALPPRRMPKSENPHNPPTFIRSIDNQIAADR